MDPSYGVHVYPDSSDIEGTFPFDDNMVFSETPVWFIIGIAYNRVLRLACSCARMCPFELDRQGGILYRKCTVS
jgi:hypothetical protein